MKKQNNNQKHTKGKGEVLFLLIVIFFAYLINQFTKKEDVVEVITNQIDIDLQHKTFKLNYADKGFVYYASIDDGKINLKKELLVDLRNKYCLKIKSESFIKGLKENITVYNFNPFIVECRADYHKKSFRKLVSDNWSYTLSRFNYVVGKGDGYLILSNKDIIELKTGQVISDNTLYNYYNKNNKKHFYEYFNVATQFKGNFFIYDDFSSINDPELNTIYKIDTNGNKKKLVYIPRVEGIPRSNIYMKDMMVSQDGKYLYVLVAIDNRRRANERNLRLIVTDLESKSIVFIKTFLNNRDFRYMKFQELSDKITITFRVGSTKVDIYTFKNHSKSIQESIL